MCHWELEPVLSGFAMGASQPDCPICTQKQHTALIEVGFPQADPREKEQTW